jgi:hypothetical protein
MSFGSLIRFALGILLSVEVLRSWLTGSSVSSLAIALSAIFLLLAAAWAVFRF